MRALTLALLLVLVLTGATCQRRGEAPVGDAAAVCYQPDKPVASIEPPDTGVRWECADPDNDPSCWDDLGGRVVPELSAIALSEARGRQACVRFLNDLKRRGIYRARLQR